MVRFVPRGRPELRHLLGPSDLDNAVPSTLWDQTGEGTWRTGIEGDAQPAWQAAAHAAGSVTAWRTFASEDAHVLRLQVVPLAVASDAAAALADATDPQHGLRGTTTEGEVLRRSEIDAPAEVAGAAAVTATAELTPWGPILTLRATVGAYLVVAVGSGPGWTWPDVADVVTAQVAKIAS